MKYTREEFRKMLIECKALAEKELCDRENGIPGESTISQLKDYIIPEMEQLIANEDNNIPLPYHKYGIRWIDSFANAFGHGGWGWSMKNSTELFDALAELNTYYRNLGDPFCFKTILRIALTILHIVLALGLTIYFAISLSETSNAELTKTFCIIAWVNIAASLLIWALLSRIIKRELYWLIAGIDDSKPYDKNVLEPVHTKSIDIR